jgi:hypothetical protein
LDRWGEIEEALRIRDGQLEEEARKLLQNAVDEPAIARPAFAGKE